MNLDTVGVSFGILGQKVTGTEDLGGQRFAVTVGRVAGLGRNHRLALTANGAQFIGCEISSQNICIFNLKLQSVEIPTFYLFSRFFQIAVYQMIKNPFEAQKSNQNATISVVSTPISASKAAFF